MQLWRVAQNAIHHQIIIKSYGIVLRPANEMKFFHQIKALINIIILSVGNQYTVRNLFRNVINNANISVPSAMSSP